MSTAYNIYRFSRPSQEDLAMVTHYKAYDYFLPYGIGEDEDYDDTRRIYTYDISEKEIENLIDAPFTVKLTLPDTIIDYEAMYKAMGFDEESIKEHRIHLMSVRNGIMEYTDKNKTVTVHSGYYENFKIPSTRECIVTAQEKLYSSEDSRTYFAGDSITRVRNAIPDITRYRYAPVTNESLADAEIPFLIYSRNKGKCFITEY